MVNVRIVAVALMAAAFIACTNTEPTAPAELEAEPQQAGSTAAKGASFEESEELLPGLPETAPASTPEPSTSALCGTGLTCSEASVAGSKACRLETSSASDIYCCPTKGDRIVDGRCVAKPCGSGLTCAASPTSGATACRLATSSTSDSYCCPIKGWRIVNGQCIPPLCGTGLVCSSTSLTGASVCRQSTTSTANVYCCPSGQTVVNGKCQ